MKKIIIPIISIFLLLFCYIYYINVANSSIETLSKFGSSGNEVKQIQQRLKDWGYYKGNVDRSLWKQNSSSCESIPKGKWINC